MDKKIFLLIPIILAVIGMILITPSISFLGATAVFDSSCTYTGKGVEGSAVCTVSQYISPSNIDGLGVTSLNLDYAPNCYFTGSIKRNPWGERPNEVLWTGTAVGQRSGGGCSFYESIPISNQGDSIKVEGSITFKKEWKDCEVCDEPEQWGECYYDDSWERYQITRTNEYCGGEFTNWKCKSYTELTSCDDQARQCNSNQDCRDLYESCDYFCSDEGLCKNTIKISRSNPSCEEFTWNTYPECRFVCGSEEEVEEGKPLLMAGFIILAGALIGMIYLKKEGYLNG